MLEDFVETEGERVPVEGLLCVPVDGVVPVTVVTGPTTVEPAPVGAVPVTTVVPETVVTVGAGGAPGAPGVVPVL